MKYVISDVNDRLDSKDGFIWFLSKPASQFWSKLRQDAKIYDSREEAEDDQKRVGGFIKEISIDEPRFRPFTVLDWR